MLPVALALLTSLWAGSPGAASTVRPPAAPTPAASPVVASADERARWRALLGWPERCEAEHAAALKALGLVDGRVQVHDLGSGRRLVVVGCALGAYQSSARYYWVDESLHPTRALPLKVTTWELDEDEAWRPREVDELAGAASFDARGSLLTILTRARGLGDCGLRVRYRMQKERLAVFEARGRACDGDPEQAAPPERWPVLPTSPTLSPARP